MLAFERIGSGPPLVLLHGVGHRRQAWYPVLEHLTGKREVILVDLPGHGESDPLVLDGRTGVRILRDELTTFFEQQGLDRPHIAGNSLGGRMALEAAVLGLARSVTAFSPAGFWRTEAGSATRGACSARSNGSAGGSATGPLGWCGRQPAGR
jgi:pimeloyl-ACP methyl ester carboxylesterase